MPSRPLFLLILTCWLCTGVWFFDRDVWPLIRPDAAPPYTIELADEAVRQSVPVRWTILRNGESVGDVNTTVRYYVEDDSFELVAKCSTLTLLESLALNVTALDMTDRVRVSRDGELRATSFEVKLSAKVLGAGTFSGQMAIDAEARGDRLQRHCKIDVPNVGTFEPDVGSVPLTHGNVLNPLHPVPRIVGLRPGQHWRQPLTDPRSDAVREMLKQLPGGEQLVAFVPPGPQSLYAEVRARPEAVVWESGEHKCLVVEYRDLEGGDFTARTWVRDSDGTVLRQEIKGHGETLVLNRN